MTAEGLVLVIGALGAQAGMLIQTWRTGRSVGSKNGTGSVHETLSCMNKKLDQVFARLDAVEKKVS